MFSDFPSLHPLIVHFPIVLILISVAFQAAVVWGNWQQIRWATLLIMGAGFFAALAASTFFHAMPSSDAPKEAMEIFASHEKFAEYTLWMSGITFLLRCIGEFFKIFKRSYESIVLVTALASAVFLSLTGHHGARLTHVAGVGPMGRYLMKDHHGSGAMEDMDHDKALKGDTTMQMNHGEPGMENMPEKDTTKTMDSMKDMPGMDKKEDKKTKGMGKMENMKDRDDKQDMKNMAGMEKMKTMDNMKDMPGMDKKEGKNTMEMYGMEKMKNMKDMSMKVNPLDTFKFEDNNPAFQKSTKKVKQ